MTKFELLLLLCLLSSITSCESKSPDSTSTGNAFTYVDTKKEQRKNDNSYNEMILFTVSESPSLEALKLFCKEKKGEFTDGVFHIVVFFDKKENATFPGNPVTGGYMEENQLKHIKATYTYNKINGYSKLDYYEKNNWESSANVIQID